MPGPGSALRPARPYAYGVLICAGARTFAAVVARSWSGDTVRTLAAVTSPAALAGSTVTVDEQADGWTCQVQLPTMDRPRDILGRDQYAALPMADLGYLDLSVAPHPRLREVAPGVHTDDDLGVTVRERTDPAGRVLERHVTRPGAADRTWTSVFPGRDAPDAGAPLTGAVRWGGDTVPTTLRRVFHLVDPPVDWLSQQTWADGSERARQVALVRSLPGTSTWPS